MIQRKKEPYRIQNSLRAVILIAFIIFYHGLAAQSSIKGHLEDSVYNKKPYLAVVALIASDSTMVKFVRTNKDGSFFLSNIPAGQYKILVTYPSHAELIFSFRADGDSAFDIGHVQLQPRADTLIPVLVTARSTTPVMNGDTLEYNTSHVSTRINANIEELLSRLPGVQVDANGIITVNGQKIDQLLVNGEDVFGGDPTIVTRNLNADMISKVQVMEKRSKKATITGMDDGNTTKALNLILKEESKHGYFGKAEAGGDTHRYYSLNGLLGSFVNERQIMAIGMASNTGITGFSGNVGSYGSAYSVDAGGGEPFGASAGPGIPNVAGGGIHYADRWNGQKEHVTGNYKFGRVITDPFTSSIDQTTLPDSVFLQRRQASSHNSSNQHSLGVDYELTPDTVSAISFSLGVTRMEGTSNFRETGNSSFNDTIVNSSRRSISADFQNQGFSSGGMWRLSSRRKKERALSLVAGFSNQDNSAKGYLFSDNSYFASDDSISFRDTTDQYKRIDSRSLSLNAGIGYTEPLGTHSILGISYGLSFFDSQSRLFTYSKSNDKYELLVDSLSNSYKDRVLSHLVSVNFQFKDRKIQYSINGDLLNDSYWQNDMLRSSILQKRYVNFQPRASIRYNKNDHVVFSLDYNSAVKRPSINQLQPIQNNSDPLLISLGNPSLRPGYTHRFIFRYQKLRPLVYSVTASYTLNTTDIATKTITDSLGRQITQPVNTTGARDYGLFSSISKRIKKFDVDIGLRNNLNWHRNVNYVNQFLNTGDIYNVGTSVFINKFVADRYSFRISSSANYNYTNNSINHLVKTGFWNQSHNLLFSLLSVFGFEANGYVAYNWRQKIANFDTHNATLICNASLDKRFFKNSLTIRWQINDILGQNIGIDRSIIANQTSEHANNVLGRYWMISATYNFSHQKGKD